MTDNEVVLLVVIVLFILSRCGCKGTGRSRVYTRKPPATEPPTFRETGERCGYTPIYGNLKDSQPPRGSGIPKKKVVD